MIRLATAFVFTASFASAQTAEQCQASFDHLTGIVVGYFGDGLFSSDTLDPLSEYRDQSRVTGQNGWCRTTVDNDNSGGPGDLVEWRTVPANFANDKNSLPESIDLRVTERGGRDPVTVDLSISHEPAEGLLNVDSFVLQINDDEMLNATAVLGGAFFDDPRAAQLSLLGLHLDQLAASIEMTSKTRPILFDEISRDELSDMMDALSIEHLGRTSLNALEGAVLNEPSSNGMLDVSFASSRGLGWMQVAAAMSRPEEERAAFLLDGAQLSFVWRPN